MSRQPETVAIRWLISAGVWDPRATHAQNMQRCADARTRWGRLGAEPSKQWAKDLISDYRAGVVVHPYAVKLAMQALGMPEETVLRRPTKPAPHPDAKERQAGDVEVQW